jgi:hypothetical protein
MVTEKGVSRKDLDFTNYFSEIRFIRWFLFSKTVFRILMSLKQALFVQSSFQNVNLPNQRFCLSCLMTIFRGKASLSNFNFSKNFGNYTFLNI